MISGRMGLWLAAQQAVLRQQLQPLAAKPGSGGGSPPHISALFQVTKAPGAPGNRQQAGPFPQVGIPPCQAGSRGKYRGPQGPLPAPSVRGRPDGDEAAVLSLHGAGAEYTGIQNIQKQRLAVSLRQLGGPQTM